MAVTDDNDIKQPGRGMENYGAISEPTAPPNYDSVISSASIGNAANAIAIGSQTCPTCRGTGFVHPDQENELVALIPLRDKRLKPRRTVQQESCGVIENKNVCNITSRISSLSSCSVCYVCLAVSLCALIGALLMFFLLPRTVELKSNVRSLKPMSSNISVLHQFVQLNIRNEYNITNQNFFPITITKMEVRVLFDGKVMADTTNTTIVNVKLRSTRLVSIDFNITFTEDMGYLAYFCNRASPFGHSIWMPFQATATTAYYGHSEEATSDFMQQVQCSGPNVDTVTDTTMIGQGDDGLSDMYSV